MKLEMAFVKSTKGTHVYGNSDSNAAITSLYIKKDALPEVPPKAIAITVEIKE